MDDPESMAELLAERMQQQATRLLAHEGLFRNAELALMQGHLNANERLISSAEERQTVINHV